MLNRHQAEKAHSILNIAHKRLGNALQSARAGQLGYSVRNLQDARNRVQSTINFAVQPATELPDNPRTRASAVITKADCQTLLDELRKTDNAIGTTLILSETDAGLAFRDNIAAADHMLQAVIRNSLQPTARPRHAAASAR